MVGVFGGITPAAGGVHLAELCVCDWRLSGRALRRVFASRAALPAASEAAPKLEWSEKPSPCV